jgi:hypothetical protein
VKPDYVLSARDTSDPQPISYRIYRNHLTEAVCRA